MIRVRVNTARALAMLERLKQELTPEKIDPIVEREAFRAMAQLVEATPQRWFGQVRKSWQVVKPQEGTRIIENRNKVMLFLEEGTANDGTGYIYPKVAKVLYIPLVRSAAGGFIQGMRSGIDYIMRPRVRGIQGRHIVRDLTPKIVEQFREAMRDFVRKAING